MSAAEQIREARRRAGLTQAQLARRCATSQARLSTYESGRVVPTDQTLRRVLRAARPLPSEALDAHVDEVHALAAEHGLRNVRVFGSVVRGHDGWDSDIDLLVDPPDETGLRAVGVIAGFADAASELLCVKVDVVADTWLKPLVAEAILAEAEPL
ncbi:MAG: helix-turn-helix domain-containing protein [Ilumatobacteraceae bacterium]